MSDKAKFYSMTKPLPFRKVRLMFRSWKEGITDIILNILYKLNKIEKYNINDVMRNEVDLNIPPKHFSSGCISADLVFSRREALRRQSLKCHSRNCLQVDVNHQRLLLDASRLLIIIVYVMLKDVTLFVEKLAFLLLFI